MTPQPNYTYRAELARVVDGDTIDVRIDLGLHTWHHCTLRIDGINCPETRGKTRAAGLAATAATVAYLGNNRLIVQTRPDPRVVPKSQQEDSFRRWLAKVWVEGVEVELGQHLLETGHAVPFEG